MVYVICVAKIESNTFSVILCMMKKITTISSIDVTTIVGAEQLRDILISFCFSHRFHDLICYLSDLILPNGYRKFVYSIHMSMK